METIRRKIFSAENGFAIDLDIKLLSNTQRAKIGDNSPTITSSYLNFALNQKETLVKMKFWFESDFWLIFQNSETSEILRFFYS